MVPERHRRRLRSLFDRKAGGGTGPVDHVCGHRPRHAATGAGLPRPARRTGPQSARSPGRFHRERNAIPCYGKAVRAQRSYCERVNTHPPKEPLWRHIVGDVLRRERHAQERTLKDVAEAARISMPYLSELERGRKEASSEVLAAVGHALGLGLADLLALAQAGLARPSRTRSATGRVAAAVSDGSAVSVIGPRRTGAAAAPRPNARQARLGLAA